MCNANINILILTIKQELCKHALLKIMQYFQSFYFLPGDRVNRDFSRLCN